MNFFNRLRAAASVLRGQKSAGSASSEVNLQHLLEFLGLQDADPADLSEATYFACIKVLSESLGKLPLKVQRAGDSTGVSVARDHTWYRTLNERPNRYMAASTFWGTMELCRNHYGNAYAWIDTRDPREPQLWPLDPRSVRVYYDDARQLSDVPDVYYQYTTPRGVVVLGSEDVLHFKSHFTLNGLVGISVREQLASTIAGTGKAQQVLNKLYDTNMTAKAVLQYTGSLNDANVQTLVDGIKAYANGVATSRGGQNIIPMPVGFSLTPLSLKLADSQFLELRQYSALQIASAFGVKPYQVGDYTKSSYASAEAQQLSFLVDTLLFIVKQYEEEIGYKLLSDEEEAAGYHVKFNTAVILRADQQTQIDTLSTAVNSFLMTPNEARSRLDLPAKDGGDSLLGNGASIPVQLTGSQYMSTAREEDKEWIEETIRATMKALLE